MPYGSESFTMALIDKYSKEELESIVNKSNSLREVILKLGYSTASGKNSETLKNRLKKYNISIEHFSRGKKSKRTIENIFCENSTATQSTLRRWYIKGKYTEYKCSICGQEPVWNNKDLTLILDHINGKNNDNKLNNLRWVCPNCNQQLETTGHKEMRGKQKLKKQNHCIDCGKIISNRAIRCIKCSNKQNRNYHNKVERPTKEELYNLILTNSFIEIGKMYGVSDNAIRKWCKAYDLPFRKNEIKLLLSASNPSTPVNT